MRKIYQLKKTSYWYFDSDKIINYRIFDELSEEFYTSHTKAFKALVNHLVVETGWDKNPYEKIKLFPREHFIKENHGMIKDKPITSITKWELIEIEPW